MKKNTFILLTAITVMACNNETAEKKAEHEKDSLQTVINQRDSALSNYLTSFNDIEYTLDSINVKQKNIVLKTGTTNELKTSVVQEINAEITAINSLIERNKKQITNLNDKLKTSGNKNEKLQTAVKKLNDELTKKQEELGTLNIKLNSLNVELLILNSALGTLNAENASQAQIIANEVADAHKAFYIIGTSKDLVKDKVIEKKGGVLGMGKTSELKNDFKANRFTQIDYTQITSIPVNSKSIEIISSHPTDSYKIEKEKGMVKDVLITNAEKFWNASKYLVIVKGA